MPVDASVVAKIEAVCEEALVDAVAAGAACVATLDAWRADVEAGGGAAMFKDRRAANEAADRPRLLMDEIKQEVLARRQEDMLALIRASPAWGYEQGSIGKTGNIRIHDSSAAAAGSSEMVFDHMAVGTSAADALGPRMQGVLAKVGGDLAEARQRWRERYIVLTPGTLECYRKSDSAEAGGTPRARRGMAGLERTLSRQLADVVSVKMHIVRSAAEAMDYSQPGPDDAEEAVPSPFFEVTFRNLHDSFKMDVLCIQADSPAEAEAWIGSINELRVGAVESTLAEDEERSQRMLDELEEAFDELNKSIAPWLEKKALFPDALRVEEKVCFVLNEAFCEAFAAKQAKLRSEPQSSAMWDIKPKYQSDTGWKDAIDALNRMLEDEEGQHLPTALERHMLGSIDSIYATHRAKHGRDVPLGADELFPIFVFVLINSEVSQMPTFIEMMSRNLDQASKGAYYSITGYAAIQFINHQLNLPSEDLEPEPEPEPVSSFTPGGAAAPDAQIGMSLVTGTIAEDSEWSEGDSFAMEVSSVALGCSGRMSCTMNGRKIIMQEKPDMKPVSLDLDLVRIMLTFKPQRAFMLQLDGNLSHFVVEDPAIYEQIVEMIRYSIAEAQLESPQMSPALRESMKAGKNLRASGALRKSSIGPGGVETTTDRPALLDNIMKGTAVDVYSKKVDDWVPAEVLLADNQLGVTVRESDSGDIQKNINISEKVRGGWSVIRVAQTTPRLTRQHDKRSEMVKLIFLVSDRDEDNLLNHADCHALAKATEGPNANMSEAEYVGFCRTVQADPAKGLTQEQLRKVYVELGLGNLDQDWHKMGLNQPIKSLLMQVTTNDTKRADTEKVRILQKRAHIARPADAREFALGLAERLQEEAIPVKLKVMSLLDTLLDLGTEEFMEAVRLMCHSAVKDALWFGEQVASQDGNPGNPGKPAAMIRQKAQAIDVKLSVQPIAAMSPIPRSSILRGTFMMADAAPPNEVEDIDLYLSLVMSWLDMSDTEAEEWRAANGTSARWEMLKSHMDMFDFDEALFKHDLAKQIFSELKGVEGAPDVSRRLAFTMSCKERELRHQTIAEVVASELHVEVQETDSAYEEGTKQFTQYRMEFTLFASSWAVDTRWSELLVLEKQIRDAFGDRPRQQKMLPTLKKETKAAKAETKKQGGGKGGRGMSMSFKAIVKKTDETLVETRKNGVEFYVRALCEHPDALHTVPFLDFVLPKWKDEVVDLKKGTADDDGVVDGSAEEELPEAKAWDDEWLGVDDVQFWEDEGAIDEDVDVNLEQATMNELVAKLTRTNVRTEATKEDNEFDSAFFVAFRAFTDSRYLLAKLWQRTMVPPAEGLDDLAADYQNPPNPADASAVSRVLNAKYKQDEAETRLPTNRMGRAVGFVDYCEINTSKICTKVFFTLVNWVEGYYTEDFAHDVFLQGMLHGFIMRMQELKFLEEGRRLLEVWTAQRKMHRGVADQQTLRSSMIEMQTRSAGGSPKGSQKSGKKQPPPPPILPKGDHDLQVMATRHNQKAMLKQREFRNVTRSGGVPTAAQWVDVQLWHTTYTAETTGAAGTSRTTMAPKTYHQIRVRGSEASKIFSFFDVPGEEIARQLTLIDYTYFSQVTAQAVAGAAWVVSGIDQSKTVGKVDQGISVVAALCWGMDVTQWVLSTIVSPTESAERLHRLRSWIMVYMHLQAMKSFNLCFLVARGLLHPLVYTLPEFAQMTGDDRKELGKMTEFVNPGTNNTFEIYRKSLKEAMKQGVPVLPYFSLHLERVVHNNRLERIRKRDQESAASDIAGSAERSQQVGEKAKKIFQDAFHAMVTKLPDREATMEGTKRRELAELRENIQAAVDDVARGSVGASPHEVSTKYQHQLIHIYILIEQVDPSPQIKADLTEIFTTAQERGNPLLASLNAKAASYVNFKHFLREYKEIQVGLLSCQNVPFNFARVGLVADMVPCGPWAQQGGGGMLDDAKLLPLSELEQIQSDNTRGGA